MTRSVSRRMAFILVFAVGVPAAHGVAPWAISLLTRVEDQWTRDVESRRTHANRAGDRGPHWDLLGDDGACA